MNKHMLKRWLREHAKRQKHTSHDNPWRFHKAQWEDLEVSVMPRSVNGTVIDSNTGVVFAAPHHQALLGEVVTNDGSAPNCDIEALNYTITGNHKTAWRSTGLHPWCIPRRRMFKEEKNATYWQAVEWIVEGQKVSQETAEATAERVLGWGPDSIQCGNCGLLIPGCGAKELIEQAREYKWKMLSPLAHDSWRCSGCATPETKECPTFAEFALMFPEAIA